MGARAKRRLGVRAKFLLLLGIVLAAAFGTLALFLSRTTADILRGSLYERARAFATLSVEPIGSIFALYNESGTINIRREVAEQAALNPDITNIQIVDVSGRELYSLKQASETVSDVYAASFEPVYLYDPAGGLKTIVQPFIENTGAHRYSLVYTVSSDSVSASVRRGVWGVVGLSAVSLLLTLGMVYFFVNRWFIRRLRQMSLQARMISDGRLDEQIRVDSGDEVGQLAVSVNTMINSLKASIEKLKALDKAKTEFMTITSHNLRTPLTVINGYLEAAEEYTTVDELKAALKEIAGGSQRLNVFAEDIITMSRLDLGEDVSLSATAVDLREMMLAIADDAKRLADLKHITLETMIEPTTCKIMANKAYLRIAIWNLVDNALKFTAQNGRITLSLRQDGLVAEIKVTDNGSGISEEEQSSLFTKFHRGNEMLTYDHEGIGIGLYTAKLVAEQLHGTITVQSAVGVGSTFMLRLPLDVAHARSSVSDTDHRDAVSS